MEDILSMNILEIARLLRTGEITSVELTEFYLRRIETYDRSVGAFLKVVEEKAMAMAHDADERIRRGENGLLLGIPLALKDILCTKGIETTCASRILEGFVPPYSATVVESLERGGYVLLGKLNMDEFAMGSSTENSAFKVTRNPWDTTRIPGGSSGGSASAVSAGLCVASLGTDTGGSIRQPAALCGAFGLKPTYGRVSRYGLIAFASSLDTIGPIARSTVDVAVLLNAIAFHDPRDSTSLPSPAPNYLEFLGRNVKGLRLGIPREYFTEGIDEDVRMRVEQAIRLFEENGAELVSVSLPHTEYAVATYYFICTAEASSNLARYDGVKYGLREKGKDIIEMYKVTRSKGFGKEVKRRIILGTFVLSSGYYDAYYRKASKVRRLIREDFDRAFEVCDLIVTPVSPQTAFRLGERLDDPLKMYLSDIFTIPASLAGLPAMSVPCGFDRNGLPVGFQIIGRPLDEALLLQASFFLEKELALPTIPETYRP